MGSNSTNSIRAKCTDLQMSFQYSLYEATYILRFIPSLWANSIALWVLCHFISKNNKVIIFTINFSVANCAHMLHHWPFQRTLCFLYFYLKYLNIYASICFLTCNSLQRYFFLLKPFRTRGWNRYDLGIRLQYINIASAIGMITVVELGEFVFSVVIITYCTGRTGKLLQEFQVPPQIAKEKKRLCGWS
ncbi:hypothetical protein FD755_024301 [Muntiacus reevesi]|uniref:G-protein coupled receptors family 1 profile domain-containing protein n=1 Tax=Muntiacus reevesi TaxID=9886 RepID=A0A5N3VAD4_MUNRE|nr:hypothetical protein FD755_024301 [Muntiacus reevesi]